MKLYSRTEAIEKMAIAIYYDDPEEDLAWDGLGETIKDKIRHVAEVAFLAVFEEESPMRLSDYEQHKMDEAYSAHMDAVEGERLRKAELERLQTAAGAYVDEMLSHTSDPAFSAKLLIADRAFLLSCMGGFACAEVTRALEALR